MEEGLLVRGSSDEGRRSFGEWGGVGRGMKEEAGKLGRLAGPMVAVNVAQYAMQVASAMMVGHLGELALSGAALATCLCNVTGFSLLLGMASALDTLCGQAFGARQYKKLGSHTYKAMLTLLLVCIPISLLWAFVDKVLTSIGQDPLISHEAGKYAAWMIPALLGYATLQPLVKFLQAQSLTFPMVLASAFTVCLHIPLCWALAFKTGLGNAGGALAIGISYWLNVVLLALYVCFSPSCKETRVPVTREAFQNIVEFLRLALPSALMICLEWWSFELLILTSGLLPNPQLETSVLSICHTTIQTMYSIPYGIAAAASTRVSNELGAGNPREARASACVALIVAVTEAVIVSLSFFATRTLWGSAYSNVEEVKSYFVKMAPLVSLSLIMDSLQGVLSGIARGCGWQQLGAYVNLGSFYLFGIPVGLILGFWVHLQGKGLWIGLLCGATTQCAFLFLITCLTNWEQQSIKARERVYGESLIVEDSLK